MSTRPPNESLGPLDNLAIRYLRQALDTSHPSDEPYVLNPVESRVIRRTKLFTLTLATLLGVLGVLLLYIPQYNWPYLFIDVPIKFLGTTYNLPIITTLYAGLLLYLEVNMLLALNLLGVRMIMHICQFPRVHDAQYEHHLQILAKAALKKNNQGIFRFGLDPYLNMPQWGLTIFFLLNLAKAALSNMALKFVLKRSIGRFALQQMSELIAIPVYAAWNAYASWQVLYEAQVRVMALLTIREFVNELYEQWGQNEQFRLLIPEALQYVSILKRQHNYAHCLLTETLADRFDLQMNATLTGHFAERAVHSPLEIRRSLERLIVFGVLVDGRLSRLEKKRLRRLRKMNVLTYSMEDIQRIGEDYNQGRGLWV